MDTHRVYREHKYTFGRLVLALRTRAALSQTALAEAVGVHRRSFQNWETGEAYPKAATLQHLIAALFQYGAFAAGQEHAEASALWQQAAEDGPYSFADFDDVWFASLHGDTETRRHGDTETRSTSTSAPPLPDSPALPLHIIDWGEAIAVPTLYGREHELATLRTWVEDDHCRVVALIGLGGIGKSSLAMRFAQQIVPQFDRVVFRSLQNGPLLGDVLDQTIRALSDQQATPPDRVPDKIALIVQLFREHRCLLILDNLEAILQPGVLTGTYRTGYAEYGSLLHGLSTREHGSCLLLTSREKPAELSALEGSTSPIRSLALMGLDDRACRGILENKAVNGTPSDLAALTHLYGGNPLALQLVAEPIRELFGSDIGIFLATGDAFFNGVGDLLQQQFTRLAPLEQTILRWFAIERELVSVSTLMAKLGETVSQRHALAALESLRRRMLIERAPDQSTFTLQPVILEYVTDQLVEIIFGEIVNGPPNLLKDHALVEATAKDYVRRSQERLIATPLLERLINALGDSDAVERQFLHLLDTWRDQPLDAQGYGPGNVVNLLRLLSGDLRGRDLSRLLLRQVSFGGVDGQDTSLADATLQESSFTGNFDVTPAVAISSNGTYWAAGSRRGDMQIWTANGQILYRMWRAHMDYIPHASVVFTPDERMLATSAQDGIVKLWDIVTGTLVWAGKHTGFTYHIVISPDGSTLATFANAKTANMVFWDIQRGTRLLSIPHTCALTAIRWNHDGHLFASGDIEGTIRVWQVHNSLPTTIVQTLIGHTAVIVRLAFSPIANLLASASWDGTVKLWNLDSGQLQQTLDGHTDRVAHVQWSPDGRWVASSSRDRTIRLWDVAQNRTHAVLHGHTAEVWSVAFTPDSLSLLSSSDDGTLRVWDVADGQCQRVIQGHAASLRDIDWSPHGAYVVSGGSGGLITVWELASGTPISTAKGTSAMVAGVRWSADGHQLVSSEWDSAINIWDARSGTRLQEVRTSDPSINFFYGVAVSPNGHQLASGTFRQGLEIIDLPTRSHRHFGPPFPMFIQHVAWSPDGSRVASGGDDTVYVWNAADGTLLQQLAGHHNTVTAIAWSPDGTRLATGNGSEGGGLFVWDVRRGERLHALVDHPGIVYAIIWTDMSDLLITGGGDGLIRWWDVQRGTCVRVREAHLGTVHALRKSPDGSRLASCGDDGSIMIWHIETGAHLQTLRRDRPYERMDLTGTSGVTDAQKATLHALGAFDADEFVVPYAF